MSMKEEIVITMWADEKHTMDDLFDITGEGEDLFGYDGYECGPTSLHIFVSKEKLDEVQSWFEKQGLNVVRTETIRDYYSMINANQKGIFYNEKKENV